MAKKFIVDTVPKTKPQLVLEAILAGGATQESLMEVIGATKATALHGQISFLNTRGMTMAEVDPSKAEFPHKGEGGVYEMISYGEKMAMQAKRAERKPGKTRTPDEMLETAQKRYDLASKKAAVAGDKLDKNVNDEIYAMREQIAQLTAILAHAMLEEVKLGNYRYERGQVE